jgi:hypothetical protein
MPETSDWEPIDLIMLRYLEVRGPRLHQNVGTTADPNAPGHIANVIINFIASSQSLAFGAPGEGVIMGDSYRTGQAGAVGPNAIAHDVNFSSIWSQLEPSISLPNLSVELQQLRITMRKVAGEDLEQDLAVAAIAQAEKAANASDGPLAIKHLRAAGSWALDIAKSIGVEVAAAAIKAAIGLPY